MINKPAGLAVQGGKGVKSSLDVILAQNYSPPPLLVHRLDKDTSGIVLTAKSPQAAALFSRLFGSDRKTIKEYIAVCAGCPENNQGVIKDDLQIRGTRKYAETSYRLIKTFTLDGLTLSALLITLGTGRMHQIRRHLAMTALPILGDDKYGNFALNKTLRKNAGIKRLLLHAHRLTITDGYQLDVTAPLPDYFDMVDKV